MRAVCLLFFVFCLVAPSVVAARVITFEGVLAKAIERSHDLKIAEFDVAAKREAVKERIFDFLPSVKVQSNAEYYKDLTQGTAYVNSVGDELYSDSSQYQNTYSLRADMTLWDFGVRAKRMEIAELDVLASEEGGRTALLDLKLAVLDEYAAASMASEEIRLRREMLPLLEEVRDIRERTYAAGLTDKISVIEAAVEMDRAKSAILEQEHDLEVRLENLSFFTGEEYRIEGLQLVSLPDPGAPPGVFDVESHPEVRRLDQEIAKKEAEASMARRNMLPVLSLYSRYSFYGTDPNSFDRARSDVSERGYNVGVVAALPLTEGVRGVYSANRVELEVSRLRVERMKKISELKNSYKNIALRHNYLIHEVETQRLLLGMVEKEQKQVARLLDEVSVDREVYLDKSVSLVSQVISLSSRISESLIAVKSMQLMCQ